MREFLGLVRTDKKRRTGSFRDIKSLSHFEQDLLPDVEASPPILDSLHQLQDIPSARPRKHQEERKRAWLTEADVSETLLVFLDNQI